MLRIGICDDEARARDALRLVLEHLLRQTEDKAFFEFSGGEGAVRWLQKHPGELDILFLDVEMGGLSGMEAARQIRGFDRQMLLVFVTGYADFVFDGYAVQALDYLIKPVDTARLAGVLARARQQLEAHAPQTYTVQNTEGMYRIPKEDILYCYSDKRLVRLVTARREYPFYAKLDQVQQALGQGFVRVHQRYLVRAGAVQAVQGGSVQVGGVTLPISRALKSSAMLALASAMVGEGELP